jgi:hypothetical protein
MRFLKFVMPLAIAFLTNKVMPPEFLLAFLCFVQTILVIILCQEIIWNSLIIVEKFCLIYAENQALEY